MGVNEEQIPIGSKLDVVLPDGTHRYWSTHCRHGNHEACAAVEIAAGVPRKPGVCKTCDAPCGCGCHRGVDPDVARADAGRD